MLLQSGAGGARTLIEKAVQPCSPDLSGACEGLGDDHRIRVRTPEGEHPALAFAQLMHRLDTLQCPVRRHRILEPATFGTQDPLEPAVISLDHIAQGVSPAGELLSSTAYARRSVP